MYVNANNTDIHYDTFGSGKAIILLHGNGEDNTIFDTLITKLASHYKIYAVDSRNHGKSEKTDDYSYETMADDISAFIQTLQIVKPIIIGFSDGAIISLLLSLKHPDIASHLIWLGINLRPSDFLPEILTEVERAYIESEDPLLQLMLTQPNIALESLSNIHSPTLVVYAENDLFRKNLYTEIVETMPKATLLEMKDHQHDSYIVHSDILYPSLMHFLERY